MNAAARTVLRSCSGKRRNRYATIDPKIYIGQDDGGTKKRVFYIRIQSKSVKNGCFFVSLCR